MNRTNKTQVSKEFIEAFAKEIPITYALISEKSIGKKEPPFNIGRTYMVIGQAMTIKKGDTEDNTYILPIEFSKPYNLPIPNAPVLIGLINNKVVFVSRFKDKIDPEANILRFEIPLLTG